GTVNFDSSFEASIGSVLKSNPTPQSNWRVNTRGNSAWFYSVWKEDSNLYVHNLFELNGFPDAQYARNIAACRGQLFIGGFYHIGKPTLITTPENIELQASDDTGMNSIFMSYSAPDEAQHHLESEELADESADDGPIFYDTDDEEYIDPNPIFYDNGDEDMEEPIDVPITDPIVEVKPIEPIELPDYGVNIYPNPAREFISIDLSNFSTWVDLSLVSETGAVVYSQSISHLSTQETLQLNLSSFSSGTYYLVVSSTNFSKAYPVLKVR
ncbi:MAG: T9SS type A sorting domain-containing protein, partial [Flavobacteriales bacterium]